MADLAITEVIEGHGLGKPGVDPPGGLIDRAQVSLGRVGVTDEKLKVGVLSKRPHNDSQHSRLAVLGKFFGQPQPAQGQTVGWAGPVHQAVGVERTHSQSQSTQQTISKKDSEGHLGAAGHRVEIVVPHDDLLGDLDRYRLYLD